MIKKLKYNIFIFSLLLAAAVQVQAQQRDRRAELGVKCVTSYTLSENGRIWLVTHCGCVHTAPNIHSSWSTVMQPEDDFSGPSLEYVAAFGDSVAIVGNIERVVSRNPYKTGNNTLRTTDGGRHWDTVTYCDGDHHIMGFCHHHDGRIWMGSWNGGRNGHIFYSTDSGRTFSTLRSDFDAELGICALYMTDSLNGFFGAHNKIYLTHDNWRTFQRLPTPIDQHLMQKAAEGRVNWIKRMRQWGDYLIVTELDKTFFTSLKEETRWQQPPVPFTDYEADALTGCLWAVSDNGILLRLTDWEQVQRFDIKVSKIVGVVDGYVYCETNAGVLRVSPEGKTDTCFFYTTGRPIEIVNAWEWDTLRHGSRLWGTDHKSIYLKDNIGWYRIARPSACVTRIKPDLTSPAHIILCLFDEEDFQLRIDTAGKTEPYHFNDPLGDFITAGVQSVEINTYAAGCFHYEPNIVLYRRDKDGWYEDGVNFDSSRLHLHRVFFPLEEADIEAALKKLSLRYDAAPTASDFGITGDTAMDVAEIFKGEDPYWTTNNMGYRITFVNYNGDTLTFYGSTCVGNEAADHTRYPWMLPMGVESDKVFFRTYQPCLWQVLKPMMPDGMIGKEFLDNSTLIPRYRPCNGDLLFFKDQNSQMEKAIRESTGSYTHVALLEVDSNGGRWMIEASPENGVRRVKSSDWDGGFFTQYGYYDAYRLVEPFDTAAVIARAKSFIGQPYDDTFLPDNGKLYCSELIYEAFLDSTGNHLFRNKPMNFRDHRGKMPKYWKKHFKGLGIPVPEGVPGSNPTDLSKSEKLKRVL